MKSIFFKLAFTCTLLAFLSCEKECNQPSGINGEWIWDESVSPWGTATPENTGEQRMLKIDDYIYREIINDSVVFESQYDLIIREDSLYADQTLIVFPSGYEEGILVNKSQLRRVETLWFDGFTHYYHRK